MVWADIYDRKSTYSYAPGTWQAAKDAAQKIIVSNLRNSAVVTTYGDLVAGIRSIIDFSTPRSPVFRCLLGQISDEQEEQGRGLLSALVVHKEDRRPGAGFFAGAEQWGRDLTDQTKCWTDELNTLTKTWT
jgi:hypothetical protein